jgi:hypothetical protein
MVYSGEGHARYDVEHEFIRESAPEYIIQDIEYPQDIYPHGKLDWWAFDNETIESVLEYLEKSSYSRYAPDKGYAANSPTSGEGTRPRQASLDNSKSCVSLNRVGGCR